MNHILVEGTEDEKFLNSYIRFLNIPALDFEIRPIMGKGNIHSFRNDIDDLIRRDVNVVIVFDADQSFEDTLDQIRDALSGIIVEKQEQQVPCFLFPNNHLNGALEDLLEQITKREHAKIFACFESYSRCIGENYITPNKKGKIYAYKEALGILNTPFESCSWDFENLALDPLRVFLLGSLRTS
ncbi:MAG: hypothetical protein F4Z81_00995 [Gemmatimonadetes bacterium]|nr:hypothetical protein [Gemmatimonadota bacterium]MYB60656.1 hypothetical protein [Gemmatimonadota bacterium]